MVVEDDYDSEYRHSDQPVEPLQSLDREGRVVYVGTFSKSLLPALRTGFLVGPRSLRDALREAKLVTTWEGDATTQGALVRSCGPAVSQVTTSSARGWAATA